MKRIIAALLLCVLLISFSGCSKVDKPKPKATYGFFVEIASWDGSEMDCHVVYDPFTRIKYCIMTKKDYSSAVAITPLYYEDGTLQRYLDGNT